MPKILKVRELTADQQEKIRSLRHSRTAAASQVERAKMIQALVQGKRVPEAAHALQVQERKVRQWPNGLTRQG